VPQQPIFTLFPYTTLFRSVDRERLFLHQRDLLAQLKDPVLPVALRVEPWEGDGKRRIVPAPRDPRRVVDEAQRAQRIQEMQLARSEEHTSELQSPYDLVCR